jgi:NodT family efflux transporter outer membrane factor (OMF) lipoprotein
MRGGDSTSQEMSSRPACRFLPVIVLGTFCWVGCAVGPNFKRPDVTLAQAWSAQSDPRINTQAATNSLWWQSLNDPVLDRLVERAYHQNLTLQMAGLRIVESRAQFGIAYGRQYPQLQVIDASANALGLTKELADTLGLSRLSATYQLGFDAAWEIDIWGKYRRGVEASAGAVLGSVADYDAAIVSLTAEVARAYVAIRTSEVLIQQAQENVRIQEEGLQIAQSRHQAGATSELDVVQAETLLESTRASIPQLEADLRQGHNALSTLLGQPTGTVEAMLVGPIAIPKGPDSVAVSIPAELLRRRPDVRSAELMAAAQCARIGVAKAQLYPSFSLFGSIGLQAFSSGPTSHNLFSPESFVFSIGPQFAFPFFNYGRLENNVRVEDARFQGLLVNYRNVVLKAAQEVEDSLAGYLKSQEAVVFQEKSVQAAQRSVQLAFIQYREGAADFQRVLDAQRSLLLEQISLTQTTSSVITDLIGLYKALGGGWETRRGDPIIPVETQKQMKERTDWGDLLTAPPAPNPTKYAPEGKH